MKRVLLLVVIGLISTKLFAKDSTTQFTIHDHMTAYPDTSVKWINKDSLAITAIKGTDLYSSPDGKYAVDNIPSIRFQPQGDFTLSAKVAVKFTSAYDGAGLIVYSNKDTWAKVLFERFKSGKNGVASTVNKSSADDAYHLRTELTAMHIRLDYKSGTYSVYYSKNGKDWHYMRAFSLGERQDVHVGFFAQSPLSTEVEAIFTNIEFTAMVLND